MKKYDARWKDVWGEVRGTGFDGELYFDFILWAGHHYVRQTVLAKEVERSPDLYGRIFEMLIDRISVSMQEGNWFG